VHHDGIIKLNRKAFMLKQVFQRESTRQQALASAFVLPDSARCVQCGMCTYSCPIGIDVRRYTLLGIPIKDSRCLTCGECVVRCPRGVLRFERSDLFSLGKAKGR
jgi:heterodisulfide reductase subunit C